MNAICILNMITPLSYSLVVYYMHDATIKFYGCLHMHDAMTKHA
jgi:hypothetical protein